MHAQDNSSKKGLNFITGEEEEGGGRGKGEEKGEGKGEGQKGCTCTPLLNRRCIGAFAISRKSGNIYVHVLPEILSILVTHNSLKF